MKPESGPGTDIVALILAAGRSRRFGSDKRRHVLPGGRALLAATIDLYQSVFVRLRVVLSPRDPNLLSELGITMRAADDVIIAADADLGMGHSLAAGATGLACRFLFVGLADMPFIRKQTLERLRDHAASLTADAILVPVCNGERGHPVGFGKDWLGEMATLTGDSGARALLRSGSATMIDVGDTGILQDIDVP